MWYFYRKDKLEPEPKKLIAYTFFLGMLIVIPAAILEGAIEGVQQGFFTKGTVLYTAIDTFIIVGPVEEFLKFCVVWQIIYPKDDFNEPMDGIIYASAAALGFATLENLGYMSSMGWEVIGIRGPLSTLGHVLFASFWGIALGFAKFESPEEGKKLIVRGVLLAMFTHGLFDFFLMASVYSDWSAIGGLIGVMFLMVAMWKYAHKQIAAAHKASPFHEITPEEFWGEDLTDHSAPVESFD